MDKLERTFERITPVFVVAVVNACISFSLWFIDWCILVFKVNTSEMSLLNYYLWGSIAFVFTMFMVSLVPIFLAYLKNWVRKILSIYNKILKVRTTCPHCGGTLEELETKVKKEVKKVRKKRNFKIKIPKRKKEDNFVESVKVTREQTKIVKPIPKPKPVPTPTPLPVKVVENKEEVK